MIQNRTLSRAFIALIFICSMLAQLVPTSAYAQIYVPIVVTGGQPTGAENTELRYDDLPTGDTDFVTVTEWDHTNLTYFFQNGTGDIAGNNEQQAVRDAFQLWADVSSLTFQEVNSAAQADIIIAWESGAHGDGSPFDGQGDVLAHAFYPPPTGGAFAGQMHFDDAENWSLALQSAGGQPVDLVTVAAHEIGHALGIRHTTVTGSLMAPIYNGSQRFLGPDDINAVQFLYGAASSNADFIVVWEDDQDDNDFYQILARGFDSSGVQSFADTTLNSIGSGQQLKPEISMAADGSFVVVWEDDKDRNGFYEILARGFNADGSEKFNDIVINDVAKGQQRKPQISVSDDGSFVVVWEDDQDENGLYQIMGRGFNADGTEKFGTITINSAASGQQLKPKIGMATTGSFVVVWEDDKDRNGLYQIMGRGFNADGTEKFSDIAINTIEAGQQLEPEIDVAANGTFVVVWQDDQDENGLYQIFARGFNANGSEKFADITVNSAASGQQLKPDIGITSDGSFVVAWEDDKDRNERYQILARGFNANGSEKFADFTVNTVADGQQLAPQISMASDGDFIVVWEDDQDENDFYQILGRGFNEDGSEAFSDITINGEYRGQQLKPSIAVR